MLIKSSNNNVTHVASAVVRKHKVMSNVIRASWFIKNVNHMGLLQSLSVKWSRGMPMMKTDTDIIQLHKPFGLI